MFTYNAKELRQTIDETLGPLAGEGVPPYEMTYRFMFGGIMAYTCGRPFASLSLAGIGLKLSNDDKEALLAAGGYGLRYKAEDPPSKSYTVIPKAIIEAAGPALEAWLIKSMDHCLTLPLPKKRKKKKQ